MIRILSFLFMLMVILQPLARCNARSDVRAGNKAYAKGMYEKSLDHYAAGLPDVRARGKILNNMGLSYYRRAKYPEAMANFQNALREKHLTASEKSIVAYNMGNAAYRDGKEAQAVEAYKTAIDLDPANTDAKYNLSFIKKKKQDKNKQQQKQQQNKKQNKQSPDPQQKQPDPAKPDPSKKDEPSPPKPEPGDINQADAQRILDKLAKDEARNPVKPRAELKGDGHVDKDW